MTTAVKRFATKQSIISAIQWNGTDVSYREIKHWFGEDVQLRGERLLFSMGNHFEPLPVGNYLAEISGSLISFTPEELADDYVAVKD